MLTNDRSVDLLATFADALDAVVSTGAVPPAGGADGPYGEGGDACGAVVELLSAYLDGELDQPQRVQVEEHLPKCRQCAGHVETLRQADRLLMREWCDTAPLPSSLARADAIDAILAALPAIPDVDPFAARRIHARSRWVRLSAGLAGLAGLATMTWSGYKFGFDRGRAAARGAFANFKGDTTASSAPSISASDNPIAASESDHRALPRPPHER